MRVHILGASGSGTTTLGRALASHLGSTHLDTDDFFWEPTDPPYQRPREVALRQGVLGQALDAQAAWVLSGSLCGWGDLFVPRFDCVIFLRLPPSTRLARLRMREQLRYGSAAIAPGGDMHEAHVAFMAWASRYDEGDLGVRSLRLHEAWLAALPCPVLRIEGEPPREESLARVAAFCAGIPSTPQGAASTCTQ